ncbi:MAG TPA: phage holin family protein [Burkholderiales bacterium]|nr:phage holin family protein [Burkholderiales bacterium]
MALQGPRAAAPRSSPGLLASVKRLGATFVATLHSRIELIAHEFERERIRVTRLLLLAVAALFFLLLGAMTATMFVIVLFWDSQRLVVIGFLTVLYVGLGAGLLLFTKTEAARSKRPFSSTVEQLRKDREHFAGH